MIRCSFPFPSIYAGFRGPGQRIGNEIMGKKQDLTAWTEAGKRNLARWRTKNPDAIPSLRHGAYSQRVHARYRDGRYREAKQLRRIVQDLVADLGGAANVTAAQRLILGNIQSKLIVLLQISKYVEKQESVITRKGELLPCLGRGFTAYSEALRRDLEALFSMAKKPAPVSYEKALRALEGGKP